MDVFYHLMYEHGRGLRDLALYTVAPEQQEEVARALDLESVSYLFRPIEDGRVNVYFGHQACVDVVASFGSCPNCHLTPEQDFMLGIMLGYDRTRQCERFLARREHCAKPHAHPCLSQERKMPCIQEKDAEHAVF